MIETFAFAPGGDPKRIVCLWCRRNAVLVNHYEVINGEGTLELKKEGAHVVETGEPLNVVMVWNGIVPEEYSADCDAAMAWIQQQVDQAMANPFGPDGLKLSQRVQNVLRANGVTTVEEARALGYGGLLRLFRMGERGAREVWVALEPDSKAKEPIVVPAPSPTLLASIGLPHVLTLRVASPWPADRIVDVFLSDSTSHMCRSHMLSVVEDAAASASASGVAVHPLENESPI